MKRILYLFLLILIASQLTAQRNAKRTLRLADNESAKLRYAYAIPLYKTYIQKGGKDSTVYKKIGFAYKMVNQYDSAIVYYQKAASFGIALDNVLAELWALKGEYKKAKQGYEQIVDQNKSLLADARLYGFSNIHKFYSDSLDYQLFYTKLNTPYNEFNAVRYKEGLIFESNRVTTIGLKKKRNKKVKTVYTPEFAWDGAGYTKLYYLPSIQDIKADSVQTSKWIEKLSSDAQKLRASSNDNRKLVSNYGYAPVKMNADTSIQLFSKQFDTKLNAGAISFTQDFQTAFYTRNGNKAKNGYMLEIWESNFVNGNWTAGKRLFFNNPNYSYFHPAITPDGNRLYYVSDEPTGLGGTDIYYVDRNEDGSWKATTNAGQDINTAGNELFPSFYDGVFFFSSNGHPGLGGLDIFRLVKNARGELSVKNMGYPVNSDKDDLSFSIKGNTGFFSSNRYGSDDIFAFDYAPVYIKMNGTVNVDSVCVPGKKVYLIQNDEIGRTQIIDSTTVDANCGYAFNVRPNKDYIIRAYDEAGNMFEASLNSNDYVKQGNVYAKNLSLINIPLSKKEIAAKLEKEKAMLAVEKFQMSTVFAKTIDSLMALTKDYVELHHPFDQVYIVQKDLNDYYKIIERVKRMHGKQIVIVSATDCNGSNEYNENLSERRAKHIYKTLSALSDNNVVIKHVGERELLKACDDLKKSIEEQVVNRYSYVFIIDKK